MATRIWNFGAVGNWFDTDNWTTVAPGMNEFPQPGDTVRIESGVAIIPIGVDAIAIETIVLGGNPAV